MADVETLLSATASNKLNVADRLSRFAASIPDSIAVGDPQGRTITFAELDTDATRIARGLIDWGMPKGSRLALLVRPGIEFVTLVFALLRAGMVVVLVDPGLGRRNLIRCLAEVEPEGFVAISAAQAVRVLLRHKFPQARWNVTVGRRWFWGGLTLDNLRTSGATGSASAESTKALAEPMAPPFTDDSAAIIFTSGSTGPPKGVLYTQRMFDTQVAEIQSTYDIRPGGIDLACFPLFALFNAAMGVTTVFPEMDFSRPAAANPEKLLAAANRWQVTQAFASPAVWRVLSDHCTNTGKRIESLRQVFSCGAPVPADVIRATLDCVGKGAKIHTPYGATECLPVSTIEAAEILGETAAKTDQGAGVCVGRKFDSIQWRVIGIADGPIPSIEGAEELPTGEIGELIVRGPQVSPAYVAHKEANTISKIDVAATEYLVQSTQYTNDEPATPTPTPPCYWHRTGDVGYIDSAGRFWYCGRKSQRVETSGGPIYTECVEAVFNSHPDVERAALVGIGAPGDELPVIAVKFKPGVCIGRYAGFETFVDFNKLKAQVIPAGITCDWMEFEEMPVDVRHNSKINREVLREGVAIGILAEPKLFASELVARARQTA